MRPITGFRAALTSFLALGLGLSVSACASLPDAGFGQEERSVYGSYLAARYAGSSRDLEASSELYAQALNKAPDSSLISQRAFFAALVAGDFERADQVAEQAANDPETAQIADLYWRALTLGRGREAVELETNIVGVFSNLVTTILQDWDAIARGEEVPWARSEMRLNASQMPSAEHWLHRALVLEHLGQAYAADAAYQNARAGMPGLISFNTLMYGAFLERQGRSAEARALYESAMEIRSVERPDVEAALARVDRGGRPPRLLRPREAAARALFPPASIVSNRAGGEFTVMFLRVIQRLDPEFHYNTLTIAQMLDSLELQEAALAEYAKIEDGPLSEGVQMNRIWLQFRMQEDESLVDEARALVELNPTIPHQLLLADMLRVTDRCSDAIPIYANVIEQAREDRGEADWRYLFYQAACTEIVEGWDVAEPLFERTLQRAPDESLVLNHLGYNLIVKGEQLERGLNMVQRAVSLDPSNGAIVDSLGWGHYKLGNLTDAIYWLERAVTLSPDSATNNWHLGDAYAAAGRQLEAEFQWRRALELDLDDDERVLIERRLELGLDAGPPDLP
ncbi:tetratricopeptide repeat protein [Oceanicaulis alexandrii]|uniref:tetratricopeptide repeat protein n=1 Tax=Oceanicaulis alexandrii TaxID=153233 RepID=UPI0035CEFB68